MRRKGDALDALARACGHVSSGVQPRLIIGGGVVGENAARVALGLGLDTVVADRNVERLRQLDMEFHGALRTVAATEHALEQELAVADLVVGAVLTPGALAPKLIRREHLSLLGRGAVSVDVAIDQGGCAETSRPTTHDEPTFVVDEVVHNCVANLPGAVPVTSTHALVNAITRSVIALANAGIGAALEHDTNLAAGVNVANRRIVHPAVAAASIPVQASATAA
jgi:alanine dehydrogenase